MVVNTQREVQAMSKTFENLARPIDIGKVRLKNRIMKNGTGYFWDDPDTGSFMDDRYIAFFEALAKGGAALVSPATGPLTREVAAKMPGYKVLTDEYIPGWKRWADAVHKHDCLAFHQLFHLGPMAPLLIKVPASGSASSIPREESPQVSVSPGRSSREPVPPSTRAGLAGAVLRRDTLAKIPAHAVPETVLSQLAKLV